MYGFIYNEGTKTFCILNVGTGTRPEPTKTGSGSDLKLSWEKEAAKFRTHWKHRVSAVLNVYKYGRVIFSQPLTLQNSHILYKHLHGIQYCLISEAAFYKIQAKLPHSDNLRFQPVTTGWIDYDRRPSTRTTKDLHLKSLTPIQPDKVVTSLKGLVKAAAPKRTMTKSKAEYLGLTGRGKTSVPPEPKFNFADWLGD